MANKTAWIEIAINASKALNAINRLDRSFKKLGDVVGIAMTAITIVETLKVIGHMEELGVKVANVTAAFEELGDEHLLANLREATGGLVSDLNLMQQAVKFKNFGLPMEQMATMLEFAQMRAQTAGESVDYMVDSIVIGLGRKSIKVLDNLQINVGAFNEQVRNGATYVEALVEQMTGELAAAPDLLVSGFTRIGAAWENMMQSIAKSAATDGSKLNQFLNWFADGIANVNEAMFSGSRAEGLGAAYGEAKVKNILEFYKSQEDRVAKLNEELVRHNSNLIRLKTRYSDLSTNVNTPAKVLEALEESIESKTKAMEIIAAALVAIRDVEAATGDEESGPLQLPTVTDLKTLELIVDLIDNLADRAERPILLASETDVELMERLLLVYSALDNVMESFGQALGQAIVYGQNFGDALVNAFKAIAAQIIATIAQAVILAALITAVPALGAALQVTGTFSQVFGTVLRGSDLVISSQRQTSRNYRTD